MRPKSAGSKNYIPNKDAKASFMLYNYENIFFDTIIYRKTKNKLEKLRNIIFTGKYNKKASQYYDLIIVLGGDDFSEFYMNNWIQKILVTKEILDMKKLNYKENVILLGQTIGPYTGVRKKIARKNCRLAFYSKWCF